MHLFLKYAITAGNVDGSRTSMFTWMQSVMGVLCVRTEEGHASGQGQEEGCDWPG